MLKNLNISRIKSEKITEIVFNLCKQANLYISKDVYNTILNSYTKEKSSKSKYILWQILENIRLASELKRPICQDTGIVVIFAEIGQNVFIEGDNFENAVNQGVKEAYKNNFFRKSIIDDPIFKRINTNTNIPAVIYTKLINSNSIKISLAVKGCGSENMSTVKMLKPSAGIEGIVDFAVETVRKAGSNPCPPVRLGIGIGGTLDYAAFLSKKALLEPIKTEKELELLSLTNNTAKLELEILQKTNDLKIGAAGFGGNTTVFGVNILDFPTHIAALPVAININCHASRHAKAEIFENNIKYYFDDFQYKFEEICNQKKLYKQVNTDDAASLKNLKTGDEILLSGYIYTARDAAHKKLIECIDKNEDLPIDIKDKIIYYTGPCPKQENEIIGPAGPTTSCRMDKYTPALLERGLLGSIGKGERSSQVIESIIDNKGIYLVATGGAAVLLSQKITEAKVIAYPELGPEAIYKLKIEKFPVIVAIDSNGNNIFTPK
ncbi:MAG: fumarate hydratase [bacterium]